MSDITTRLRETTEQMACTASVDMALWDKHSNACLEAADEIDRLCAQNARLTGQREGWKGLQHGTSDIVKQLEKENEKLRAALLLSERRNDIMTGDVEKLRAALSELVGAASRVNMRTGTEFYTAWRAAYDITKAATIEDYSTVRAAALKETDNG